MARDGEAEITRRGLMSGPAGALVAAGLPGIAMAGAASEGAGGGGGVAPTIFPYLADLQAAADQIADTWRPNDPQYRVDIYRQILMNLSYSYFAYFHADAEHPDWAPLWNNVFTDQPNPDDIYLYTPLRGDLTYRVSGNRGTCAYLIFNARKGSVGMVDDRSEVTHHRTHDQNTLGLELGEDFEVIFSAKRPEGYTGKWAEIAPEANAMVVRFRSIDWAKERDPVISIECLDKVPLKPRLSQAETLARIQEMCKLPGRYNKAFFELQNVVKRTVGVNAFMPQNYGGGMSDQVYLPAVFELEDGEALIIETELPKVRPYWNFQLDDPYFNAVEFVYRRASLNASDAHIDSDGRLRMVVSLEDAGVPNWLDPGGFKQGTIYGRWLHCDSSPLPTIKRVPLAQVRKHLPADTPVVSADERAAFLRERVRAYQRRRRW